MIQRNKARVIFHIDMNSFYASVEVAHQPHLKGKPIAIAGNPEQRKGIVVTSSYEARAKGVKTTMALWEAKRLCPELIVIPPDFTKYRNMSAKIFQLLSEMTPIIEPVSIDEGYMDVTDQAIHPLQLAEMMQERILKTLHIPCSIGIGPNKFLAKTASDMKKPLGITVLRIRDIETKLWPLTIDEMYGVGEKTAEKLRSIEIETIGDLAAADPYVLNQLLGINGERLKNRANGIDPRKVDPDSIHDFKSIGNSQTLPADTTNVEKIKQLLSDLTSRVEERLQRRNLKGQTIQLMLRYHDRTTITRSKKMHEYMDSKAQILPVIYELFDEHWNEQAIRLLGVTVQDLLEKEHVVKQLSLFSYEQDVKEANIEETVNQLKEKYGEQLFVEQEKSENQPKLLRTSFQKDFLDDFKQHKKEER